MIRWLLPISLAVAAVPPATAQGLPAYRSINPVLSSRSGLGFLPLVEPSEGWRTGLIFDYGSLVELSSRPPVEYVLDSEVLRLSLALSRSLGRRGFVEVTGSFTGAYAGFLDRPIQAYHDLVGFQESVRATRPENEFDYRITLPEREFVARPSDGSLGDLRLSGGVRLSPHWQLALSLTLPTHTGPDGYGVGTVATALTGTARSGPLGNHLTLEGSAGLGFTPTAGELAPWQRSLFGLATGGVRFRFWGQQSVFTNLIYHSPAYRNTTIPALDREDLSLDVGFLFRPGGGPEILMGLTEDLYPFGPAVDLVLRLGARW